MSDRWPLKRLAPLALIIALAVAILLPGIDPLQLANPDEDRVTAFREAVEELPDGALVLVAFDADIGTYAEIRPVVRSVIDELLARRARLAFVSYTPEGRALARAEMERLAATGQEAILDLGFRSGAEAALVRSVDDLLPADADGDVAEAIRGDGGGMAAFEAALIVAGNDLGPRAWIEQVAPRTAFPLLAVAPGYLAVELEPYLASGQLAGLLGSLRDGAAYVESAGGGHAPLSSIAIMLGMLVAIGVLLQAAGGTLLGVLRGAMPRPRA